MCLVVESTLASISSTTNNVSSTYISGTNRLSTNSKIFSTASHSPFTSSSTLVCNSKHTKGANTLSHGNFLLLFFHSPHCAEFYFIITFFLILLAYTKPKTSEKVSDAFTSRPICFDT